MKNSLLPIFIKFWNQELRGYNLYVVILLLAIFIFLFVWQIKIGAQEDEYIDYEG